MEDADRSVAGDLGKLAVKTLKNVMRSRLNHSAPAAPAAPAASTNPQAFQQAPPQGYQQQHHPPPQQQHGVTFPHQQLQQPQTNPAPLGYPAPLPPAHPAQPYHAPYHQHLHAGGPQFYQQPQYPPPPPQQQQQQGVYQQGAYQQGAYYQPSATFDASAISGPDPGYHAGSKPSVPQPAVPTQPWVHQPPSHPYGQGYAHLGDAASLPGMSAYQQHQPPSHVAAAAPPSVSVQNSPYHSEIGSVNGMSAPPAPAMYQQCPNFTGIPSAPAVRPALLSTSNGVSAALHLAGQFVGMGLSGVSLPTALNDPAPPTSSGAKLCKGWDAILDQELLMQVNTRPFSARAALGDTAVVEARKGLSRVLQPGDDADLELFAQQLKHADASACEPNFRGIKDKVVCFAMSYVHTQEPVGRFKFTAEQWDNFKAACREISDCGVKEMKVWLDQCLWLRDASQGAWAHTGLMPYVLWPVISLGVKAAGGERTLETFKRMWPFVEEVAGLWSMGVIITSELRGSTPNSGCRRWMSFQLRERCEPEMSMRLILLNIFHGAVDDLHTGWKEDVLELKEMAKWNFTCQSDDIIVGSDWRARIANLPPRSSSDIVSSLHLSHQSNSCYSSNNDSVNMYVDGSRKLVTEGPWNGVKEWTSGNYEASVSADARRIRRMQEYLKKINLITDEGEFQLLGQEKRHESIWLLVAMDGRSSRFSRGHVAWTKVMHGESTWSQLAGLGGHCRKRNSML